MGFTFNDKGEKIMLDKNVESFENEPVDNSNIVTPAGTGLVGWFGTVKLSTILFYVAIAYIVLFIGVGVYNRL